MQVQRAVAARAGLIRKTLADGRRSCLVPGDRALVEADGVAALFRGELAVALDAVERLYGAKEFHGQLSFRGQPPKLAACRLGGVKDGRGSDVAPTTVDTDW